MIRSIPNNRPEYSEAEWEAVYCPNDADNGYVKCIHRKTGEVMYFSLEEYCGF
jgi:hypothetical protein